MIKIKVVKKVENVDIKKGDIGIFLKIEILNNIPCIWFFSERTKCLCYTGAFNVRYLNDKKGDQK